jgi:hypothetical protein
MTRCGKREGANVAAVLEGVKVLEVAGWTFVPAGGGFVQTPAEVLDDPQVRANGYVRPVTGKDGEHTDEIPENELGLDWDAIVALKLNNTVN